MTKTTFSTLEKYGTPFQIKVLSLLLNNKTFLQNISDVLSDEYFSSQSSKWIINEIIQYYRKYHTNPTIDVLKIEVKKIDNEVLQVAVKETLREAYTSVDDTDLEYVEEQFSGFCKNQQLKKALLSSVELLNDGEYDSIRILIDKALHAGAEKSLGHIYEKDVETRYRENERKAVPFPWNAFNNITQGGYGKGELILIFGPPKAGKSWVVSDMAAYAGLQGFNVVYYTLELDENYVGKRIDAYLSGIDIEKLGEHRELVEQTVNDVKGRIVIKNFPAGKTTFNDIEGHLRQLDNFEKFKPDAIFIDYLDLLKNRNKSRKEKIDDIDDIYVDARGLAKEYGVPVVSPSQINRAGSGDDIIQADKIAGAYNKFFTADLAISLSRKMKDKVSGTGRFHIMGNRMGDDGLTYIAKINTKNGAIEISENPMDGDEIEEMESLTAKQTKKVNGSNLNGEERDYLKEKFFKLQNQS